MISDAGLLDQLSHLSIIDSQITPEMELKSSRCPSLHEEIVESVLSLASLLADLNLEYRHAGLHAGLLQFIATHFDMLSRHLFIKGGLKTDSRHNLLLIACELVTYAGPDANNLVLLILSFSSTNYTYCCRL